MSLGMGHLALGKHFLGAHPILLFPGIFYWNASKRLIMLLSALRKIFFTYPTWVFFRGKVELDSRDIWNFSKILKCWLYLSKTWISAPLRSLNISNKFIFLLSKRSWKIKVSWIFSFFFQGKCSQMAESDQNSL